MLYYTPRLSHVRLYLEWVGTSACEFTKSASHCYSGIVGSQWKCCLLLISLSRWRLKKREVRQTSVWLKTKQWVWLSLVNVVQQLEWCFLQGPVVTDNGNLILDWQFPQQVAIHCRTLFICTKYTIQWIHPAAMSWVYRIAGKFGGGKVCPPVSL